MKRKKGLDKKFLFIFFIFITLTFIFLSQYLLGIQTSYKSKASEPSSANLVVGGNVGNLKDWPFLVRIKNVQTKDKIFGLPIESDICSGSLISPTWIITAAHCLTINGTYDVNLINNILVNFGGGTFKNSLFDVPWTSVKNIFLHDTWKKDATWKGNNIEPKHDIALIQLKDPLLPQNGIQPQTISLNDDSSLEQSKLNNIYQYGLVLGYGRTKTDSSSLPKTFYYAVIPIIDWSAVSDSPLKEKFYIGYPKGGANICSGDSGGPFIRWNIAKRRWALTGIISSSSSSSCGGKDNPSALTSISNTIDWIKEKTITSGIVLKNSKKTSRCYGVNCRTSIEPYSGNFIGNQLSIDQIAEFNCRINNQGPTPTPPSLYTCGHELEGYKTWWLEK